ncbi:Ribosomal protein L9/RNase H1 [Thalictrum thalictroides]|uniref:Large ribosomal subunit protein bL9c n=1 Tax=Thalictrum thalictroides TaxID=46969 RepID=A0A7J6W694_THATH|nr:Ribosomal protein L9/RNase H1 [Thalictrum thalictroides]
MANFNCGRNVLRQLINNQGFNSSGSLTNPLLFSSQGLRYRKLEVILTTSIDKLGKAGETVKVAPGYFRNHLMPKLLAVPNIEKYAYLVREQRKLYQREEVETVKVVPQTKQDIMKEYQTAANRLENAHLVLRRQVQSSSSLNELRSPVTKEELVAEETPHTIYIAPEDVSRR